MEKCLWDFICTKIHIYGKMSELHWCGQDMTLKLKGKISPPILSKWPMKCSSTSVKIFQNNRNVMGNKVLDITVFPVSSRTLRDKTHGHTRMSTHRHTHLYSLLSCLLLLAVALCGTVCISRLWVSLPAGVSPHSSSSFSSSTSLTPPAPHLRSSDAFI